MSYGVKKVEKRIRYILSKAIIQEVQDPRLGFVTITDVRVSPDFRHARVYVSIMGSDEEQEKGMKTLRKARGYLQKFLAKNLSTRSIPQLSFHEDEGMDRSQRFSEIFDQIAEEREARAEKELEEEVEPGAESVERESQKKE